LNKLSPEEFNRYSRHLILKDFGIEAQQKLKSSSALVVGAGGLGCPVIQYLSAAGIGKLGIADADSVHRSNLPRQTLYAEQDIGRKKAEAAMAWVQRHNANVQVEAYTTKITSSNALSILGGYEVIIDCSDNFPTRYLLNDAAVLLNKPLVYGSVLEYEGQVAVFNVQHNQEHSANYRDVFPTPPLPGEVPSCEQSGVLGVLPGIIGMLQANEVTKLITGTGEVLKNKLMVMDSLTLDVSIVSVQAMSSSYRIDKLIDYETFCGINANEEENKIKELSAQQVQQMLNSREEIQMIDVREPFEHQICNIGGLLIPQHEMPERLAEINRNKKVILYCKTGDRSAQIKLWLENTFGFTNLYSLRGGIMAWIREIDSTLSEY
jgi:adenylyltransferase/sulfurtransferase